MSRARALAAALAAALLLSPAAAVAGAQVYEELAQSVRSRMSAAIADKSAPAFAFGNRDDGNRWIAEMSRRLEKRIPDQKTRVELLRTLQFEALRAGLDPQLVLGVIEVESGFRKYAVSRAGARGYMQVMPFWIKLIGAPGNNLFSLRVNLRYGCVILRHYLDMEKGDYFRALGRYNGSIGQLDYPRAVLAAWKVRWGYLGATS